MTHQPMAVDTQTVLEDLVNQFSDPHAFFRELIQNAIDAGSGEVDIRFEFEPGEGDQGVMIAHIDDFGEGMSREIIETKLTRLFSSGKDEDFTKIGRFGIGFVSVFAIAPDAVCVDTGRAGVYWRVLFHKDRTFDLISMQQPTEGTKIRVIKTVTRPEFERFKARAEEVVRYWCKHVQVPIFIEDEEINAPFTLESLSQLTYEEEGTRIVMGFVSERQAPYGFYNRGLTLKEGEECPWPHIHLKIDSRYLEHTLTRDQVLQDKNYHKAMDLLRGLAEKELPNQLFDQLAHAATRAHEHPHEYHALATLALGYLETYGSLDAARERVDIFPMLYGPPTSARALKARARKGEVFRAVDRTHLSDALQEDVAMLPAKVGDPLDKLASLILERSVRSAASQFVRPSQARENETPEAKALCELLRIGIQGLGGRPEWVGLGHMNLEESPVTDHMACCLEDRLSPTPAKDVPQLGKKALTRAKHVVLNADDRRIKKLLRLARTEPEWASYTALKMLLLHEGLDPKDDALLLRDAVDRRARRGGAV